MSHSPNISSFLGTHGATPEKLVVRANDNPNLKLLRVIKGPVTNYFPDNTLKLGTYLALHTYIHTSSG